MVQLETTVNLTEDLVGRLLSPFWSLAKMGQWGGMAGDKYDPQQSTITLATDSIRSGTRSLRWDFKTKKVHPGTAFVIQNIIHFLHLHVTPIESLVLRSPLLLEGVPLKQELPYDYVPTPYPFPVTYDRQNIQVFVDVEFRVRSACSRQKPSRSSIERRWNSW